MIRVVLDANIFVSALIRPEGPPGRLLLELVEREAFELIVSPGIVEEIRRALREDAVRRYVPLTPREAEAWLSSALVRAVLVEGKSAVEVVAADPQDDEYFAASVEGAADFLVTGDKHILDVKRYGRTVVVTPRAFLEMLRI